MTLLQLRYLNAVAAAGTFSQAAQNLFISQPGLTKAIKELEEEAGITLFERTNKGVTLTKEGVLFLGYARQVLEQMALLEEKYKHTPVARQEFAVSTQHYSFAVKAFVSLIEECGGQEYDFNLRECQTYEIIDDVAKLKSEIGVLYCDDFNRQVLTKLFKAQDLTFTPLFSARPHVFISDRHPLAGRAAVTLAELADFPYLSYEQGEHNALYFSEEICSTEPRRKNIRVRDRATLFNLLIGLNGYTVCSGVIDQDLNGSNIIAVPLQAPGLMEIGCLTHNKVRLSRLASMYLQKLQAYARQAQGVILPSTAITKS